MIRKLISGPEYIHGTSGGSTDLETLLAASVELMKLRNENKLLLRLLAEANQKLEAYRGRGNNDRCLVGTAESGRKMASGV